MSPHEPSNFFNNINFLNKIIIKNFIKSNSCPKGKKVIMHVKSVVKMLLINFRAAEQRKKVKKRNPPSEAK